MPAPVHTLSPPLVFGVLGAVSGLLSSLNAAEAFPALNVPALYYGMPPDHIIPLWPAIAFGLALAIGAFVVQRRIATAPIMLGCVIVGWWMVMEYAALPLFTEPGTRFVGPLLFGFNGAFIVALGGLLAGLYDGRWQHLALISGVGAVAGLLMLVDISGLWVLFVGWQAAVGAAIGSAFARSKRQPAEADKSQQLNPGT